MVGITPFFKTTLVALLVSVLLVGCTPALPAPTAVPTLAPTSVSPVEEAPAPTVAAVAESIAIITYVEGDVFVADAVALQRSPGLMAPVPQAATPTTALPTTAPPAATQAANPAPTLPPPPAPLPTAIPPAALPPAQPQAEQPATAFQQVAAGATVRTAPDSSATIVCLSGQAYRVTGGQRVAITSTLCQRAQPLPANSIPAVAPNNGSLVEKIDSSVIVEGETRERESDYGQLPIILSPRNTSLLTLTPTLTWVDVSGALEYVLRLSGLSSFDDVVIVAADLACVEDERTAPNRICTVAWPAAWPIEPAQRYFFTVSARTGIASPLRESETSALRTLTAADAAQLQATVAEIEALDLDPVTRNLLLAGHYRAYGVLEQAIVAYVQAYALQPVSEVAVALGDLYLKVDLQRFALRAYQDTLDQLATAEKDNPAARAAAEFGIGLVYYSRANYAEAEPHFVEAVELYTQIGAESERNAAQAALQATRERLS